MDGKADPNDDANAKLNAVEDEIPEHHTQHTKCTHNTF